MKNILKLLLVALLAAPVKLAAQMPAVEMADTFRQDGKIYVVISIMAIILLGIAAYLFALDRKIGKLEKKD
ncbi:MAG: CcmD family protein [Bacteroidetes bacterium]|nr:CcmD family protein [Bacteroidota bacterium]